MHIDNVLLVGIEHLLLRQRLLEHGYGVLSVESIEEILQVENRYGLMIIDQALLDASSAPPPERLYFLNNSVPVAVLLHEHKPVSTELFATLNEGSFDAIYCHEIESGLICKRIDRMYLLARLDRNLIALQQRQEEQEKLQRELAIRDRTLQREQGLNAAIVNSITAGLIIIDVKGDIMLVNNQALCYFVKGSRAITGSPYLSRLAPELHDCARELFTMLPELHQTAIRKASCHERFLELQGYPLHSERNERIGLLVLLIDITEQEKASIQLYRAEKLATVGTMLSGIAHELRNPLSIISARAQRGRVKSASAPEWVGRGFDSIEQQAMRCADIVNTLLDFTRTTANRSGLHDIAAILDEALAYVRYQNIFDAVTVEKNYAPGLTVYGDRSRFVQVFVNLYTNAAQAMSGTGTLRLATDLVNSGKTRITVRDTGSGIPPENGSRVFDPFFTTKSPGEGTGLGLSIAQKIVRESGGEIHFESRPGHTQFSIELPFGKEPSHATTHSAG